MSEPKPIPTDQPLMLVPANNGGWLIQSADGNHMVPLLIGAFTTPADMLVALGQAFYPMPEVEADGEWPNVLAKSTGFATKVEGQK